MSGYKFDYEKKVWGGEILRLSPIHFRAPRLYYALLALKDVNGKLLDVGCGAGDFPEAFGHYRPDLEISAIDISQKAIKIAKRRKLKVDFKVGNAEKLPFESKSFEAVTCFDLIEHVEHPERVISEIERVLKPGGIFHTFIPTEDRWLSPEGMLIKLGWKGKEIYGGHPQHYSPDYVRKKVSENGFRIIKSWWGEHLVNQIIEIIFFSWLSLRGKNLKHSVEGYLSLAQPSLATRLLRLIKNALSTISYFETRLLWWFPGLGLHITCLKK